MEEIDKLANSVEEFTTSLIDPLKSDTREREAFGDTLDLILDKAIEHNQEKVSETQQQHQWVAFLAEALLML